MINHQTLRFENLGLEKLAAPRNASRAKKRNALAIPRHSPMQISVSPSAQPKVSTYYQDYGSVLSTVPNVTEALLVQPRLSARDSGSTVQRSTLSVLMYRDISVCSVDK